MNTIKKNNDLKYIKLMLAILAILIALNMLASCSAYRMEYKSKITGYENHGQWFHEREYLDGLVNHYDTACPDLTYWVDSGRVFFRKIY